MVQILLCLLVKKTTTMYLIIGSCLACSVFPFPHLSPTSICLPHYHCSIPSMEDLGFESASLYTNVWVGGETEALRKIPQYCQLRCQQTENHVSLLTLFHQLPSDIVCHCDRLTCSLTSQPLVRTSDLVVCLFDISCGRPSGWPQRTQP